MASLFCAVANMPTPIGFVTKRTSPSFAVLFFLRFAMGVMPVTASPKIGSVLSMLCPPASGMPASAQMVLAPSSTSAARAAGSVLTGQPSMAIAMSGFPPIAYTSLIALALAIFPNACASSTMGVKKSVVLIMAWPLPIS